MPLRRARGKRRPPTRERPVTASVLRRSWPSARTPLLRLQLPGVPARVELWGKCEWFNPGGSVKDRTALSIVTEGERTGALVPGKVIVDSSSGNTAVGLALVGRAKGYAVELVMPESVAGPRRRAVRGLRRRARASPTPLGLRRRPRRGPRARGRRSRAATSTPTSTAIPANPLAHYRTTGPEIWDQTGGPDHPLRGRARHLGHHGGHRRASCTSGSRAHPRRGGRARPRDARPGGPEAHGDAPSSPRSTTRTAHDEKVTVEHRGRVPRLRARCCASDGLLVGHSAGAALVAAREVARARCGEGVIVALLPDGGERYLGEAA